jgi:hypothetical protein
VHTHSWMVHAAQVQIGPRKHFQRKNQDTIRVVNGDVDFVELSTDYSFGLWRSQNIEEVTLLHWEFCLYSLQSTSIYKWMERQYLIYPRIVECEGVDLKKICNIIKLRSETHIHIPFKHENRTLYFQISYKIYVNRWNIFFEPNYFQKNVTL